jgi:hypothetical protein
MKARIFTLLAATLIAAASLNAAMAETTDGFPVELSDEAYVDDVPFDTKVVVDEIDGDKKEKKQPEPDVKLDEEEYVNDENIDTRKVVLQHFGSMLEKVNEFAKALGANFREINQRGYMKNNQLNIQKIYEQLTEKETLNPQLPPEPEVDDVPFDTADIVNVN